MFNKKWTYKPITLSCFFFFFFSETMQKENIHIKQMYEINKEKNLKKQTISK